MPSGIIVKGIGGFYYVASENGTYECKARGIFRKDGLTPVTGDRVEFSITDPALYKGSIDEILERSSLLTRPAVANVSQLIAVIAARSPEPDLLLLDKLLITAERTGLGVVICINKTDLDGEGKRKGIIRAYAGAGYKVFETSLTENTGLDSLKGVLKGHVSVLAGQSGVGKSTILNRIMNDMVMKTGELSEKTERGRHTTRHAELMEIDGGGYVVDTPGFSSFELSGISRPELQLFYPEFAGFSGNCRFRSCSHVSEPSCGIRQAVAEGLIDEGRYGRYVELYLLIKQQEDMKYKKK